MGHLYTQLFVINVEEPSHRNQVAGGFDGYLGAYDMFELFQLVEVGVPFLLIFCIQSLL